MHVIARVMINAIKQSNGSIITNATADDMTDIIIPKLPVLLQRLP